MLDLTGCAMVLEVPSHLYCHMLITGSLHVTTDVRAVGLYQTCSCQTASRSKMLARNKQHSEQGPMRKAQAEKPRAFSNSSRGVSAVPHRLCCGAWSPNEAPQVPKLHLQVTRPALAMRLHWISCCQLTEPRCRPETCSITCRSSAVRHQVL